MTAEPLVNFINVQKTYDGETLVITNLNFAVQRGEFLTLLGPSGSGKSTTLLMLAGFEHPTSGRIEIEGKQLVGSPAYKRDFGMVFQDYALFPHMTVAENVAFPLSVRKLPKRIIASRVAAALDMVKLDGLGERRPTQLSGGQQQRVALARALVFEPRLVLMDEPLGALDKQLREQMQLEIKHLQKNLGVTVVYVTHDQAEALTMSDRVAVFNKGGIHQMGTPTEIYDNPQDSFVAQFVGENNRLYGTVISMERDTCEVQLDGGIRILAHAADAGAVGARAALWIRPERIAIGAADDRFDNTLQACVEELIFLGDHTRARVSLPNEGGSLMVKLPVSDGLRPLQVGMPVMLGCAARHCRALAA